MSLHVQPIRALALCILLVPFHTYTQETPPGFDIHDLAFSMAEGSVGNSSRQTPDNLYREYEAFRAALEALQSEATVGQVIPAIEQCPQILEHQNEAGETLFMAALRKNRFACARDILRISLHEEGMFQFLAQTPDAQGITPLRSCIELDDDGLVQLLLSAVPVQVGADGDQEHEARVACCIEHDSKKCFKLFTAENIDYYSPARLAFDCLPHAINIWNYLTTEGQQSPSALNEEGNTILHEALRKYKTATTKKAYRDFITALVEYNPELVHVLNSRLQLPLHLAAQIGELDFVDSYGVIQSALYGVVDEEGETPLSYYVKNLIHTGKRGPAKTDKVRAMLGQCRRLVSLTPRGIKNHSLVRAVKAGRADIVECFGGLIEAKAARILGYAYACNRQLIKDLGSTPERREITRLLRVYKKDLEG